MVEFDTAAHVTVFNYAGLKDYIASLFDGPVDVVNRDGLKPYIRPAATADAIYAFLRCDGPRCATSRTTSILLFISRFGFDDEAFVADPPYAAQLVA
jgi:hypothetical protein